MPDEEVATMALVSEAAATVADAEQAGEEAHEGTGPDKDEQVDADSGDWQQDRHHGTASG
jgi:Ni/Co efflux regulator RcnB